MNDELRDRIAKAVLDKILAMFAENDPVESASAYIADAILALPGIAVVELPEPDNGRNDQWLDATIFASKNTVFLDVELGQVERWTPSEARTRAAALLAAADHAERDLEREQ